MLHVLPSGFVKIRLWDNTLGVHHQAEVRWVKKIRWRQYEIGLQFVDFGPEVKEKISQLAAHFHADTR